jgi:GT2 family glycosyltransferase
MNSEKDLTVLILQYNSSEYTINLLKSVVQYEFQNLDKYRWIIMDNASKYPMRHEIITQFPFIEFVQYDENLGFAGAHNRIFPTIKTKWILLLNNDCILLNNAVTMTLENSKKYAADFSTCALYNEDMSYQNNFSTIATPMRRILINFTGINRLILSKIRASSKRCSVGYINGAFLLINRNSLKDKKLFTDRYFMYTEDLDLMFRFFKWKKKGWRFSEGKVIHLGGKSAVKKWENSEIDTIKHTQYIDCLYEHFSKYEVKIIEILKFIK